MPAKPNEIQITRVYDAPVKLVWAAWTEPKHVEQWWGPRGFTLTTKSKDFRPGGKWIYTMHGPDGTDYPNVTTYHEIVKYEKLAYDHGGDDQREQLFSVVVTFREEKGKTVMCMTMALATPEAAAATKKFIKSVGGNSTWDRLGEYLEQEATGKEPFLINRSFAAGIETVFDMWVNPEHFVKWLGPTGATMSFASADVRSGGTSLYSMTNSDGFTMHGKISYRTIEPPRRLVYTQCFCDPEGKLIKPPFSPTYPDVILTTVTFAEEDNGETRVTVRWEAFDGANEAERRTFRDMRANMTGGWSGSFDKLDALLGEKD